MTNRSIIEIDVNDQQFKAFYAMFEEYSAKVEELPDDWKKVAGATADTGKAMAGFGGVTDTAKESLAIAVIQAEAIGKAVGDLFAYLVRSILPRCHIQ